MLQAAGGNVGPGQGIALDTAAILLDIAPGIAGLVLDIVQGTVVAAAGTLELALDKVVLQGTAVGTAPGRIPVGTQAAPGTAALPPCRPQDQGCRLSLLAGRRPARAQHFPQSGPLPTDCHPTREEEEKGRRRRRLETGAS